MALRASGSSVCCLPSGRSGRRMQLQVRLDARRAAADEEPRALRADRLARRKRGDFAQNAGHAEDFRHCTHPEGLLGVLMVTHGYSRVRTLLRVQLPRCKACAHMRVARPRSRQAPCVPSARLANETGLTPPTSARECAHADGPAAVDKAPAAYRRRGRRRCTGARRLCLPPRVGPARTRSCPLFARIIRESLVRARPARAAQSSLAVRSYEFWGFKQRDAVVNAIRHVSALCHQRALYSIQHTPVLTGTLAHDIRRAFPPTAFACAAVCIVPTALHHSAGGTAHGRAVQVASARSHYILLSLASEEEDVEYQTRWAPPSLRLRRAELFIAPKSTQPAEHTARHSARHSTQRTTCSAQHTCTVRGSGAPLQATATIRPMH